MIGWLTNLIFGTPAVGKPTKIVRVKARYDAAVVTDSHWRNADSLSARSANSLDVRRRLRDRARYEIANNCHARGITLTMANDVVGTGPLLQVGFEDDTLNEAIEMAFARWSSEIYLAEKLHVMALAKVGDGEAFALFSRNADLYDSVKLDIVPIECDQVSTPVGTATRPNWVDGIEFDDRGNPVAYHVLRNHPGDPFGTSWEADTLKAANVLHWFRCDRPGQLRGIPEITPALPLFAQLRRYTLAVIEAAETAADFAAVLHTENTPDSDTSPSGQSSVIDPFEGVEVDKGMMVTVPAGYRMSQFTPTQPTATHDEFCKTILKEIFHCLNMPYAVGSGDYADDSYSSGRLGKMTYMRSIKVARVPMYRSLDRIFMKWFEEAVMIPGYFGAVSLPMSAREIPHQWHFRDDPYVDPLKDAQADAQDIANGTSTLAEKCAERGLDYRDVIRQQAKEKQLRQEAGLDGMAEEPDEPADEPSDEPADEPAETPEEVAV